MNLVDFKNMNLSIKTSLKLFISSILIIHFIVILFGAPFFDQIVETLAFSFLLASLTILPIFVFISHSNTLELFTRLFLRNDVKNFLEYRLVCISKYTVYGAWFGSFVIPLDWDRWWQKWPISCVFGALIGFFIGLLKSFVFKPNLTKSNV
jgi:GPI ethanolamine phosphate transferase 2/3 subunit F